MLRDRGTRSTNELARIGRCMGVAHHEMTKSEISSHDILFDLFTKVQRGIWRFFSVSDVFKNDPQPDRIMQCHDCPQS